MPTAVTTIRRRGKAKRSTKPSAVSAAPAPISTAASIASRPSSRAPSRNPNGQRSAPHINVWIVARGINIGLNTRIYFSDEAAANAADPVLNLIELPVRRTTLIAERAERDGKTVYTFNVYLQGPNETVFFDV